MKLALSVLLVAVFALSARGEVKPRVNNEGFIVLNFEPAMDLAGVDMLSAGGFLVPIPPDENGVVSAEPFSFLLSNTNRQVTFAKLGDRTRLEGDWVTAVGYDSRGDFESDLSVGVGPGTPFTCGVSSTLVGSVAGANSCEVDFGMIPQGDHEAGVIPDIIELGWHTTSLAFPIFTRVDYDITGPHAELFDLPDYEPTQPFSDLIDVAFDVSADLGVYEAELNFGPSAVFQLRAEVVPEPSGIPIWWIVFLWFHQRRDRRIFGRHRAG